MKQLADDVLDIAEEEIGKIEDPTMQDLGNNFLEQWISSTHEDFCEAIFKPQIAILPKSQRRVAKSTMRRIKERLAARYDREARNQMQHRKSAEQMHSETLAAYELIERIGRGVVYFGSARTKPGGKFYDETLELAREVATLLKTPAWTGAGPGQMEAPLRGASESGVPIGGIKISLNGHQSAFEQEVCAVLNRNDVVECAFFGPRKIGLVDASMRQSEDDKTGIIVTPGGFGTLDEFFEFVTLKQLKKLGTKHPVPIIVMNYDGFYDDLISFLTNKCVEAGTINDFELDLFHIAESNEEALDILAATYNIPQEEHTYRERISNTREHAENMRRRRLEEVAS